MPKSYYHANEYLKWILGLSNAISATGLTRSLRLWTTLPAYDGTGGVEVSASGTAYAAISPITSYFGSAPVNGVVSNTVAISFTTATAGWGTVVGATIHDGSANLLRIMPLRIPKTILLGQQFRYEISAFQLAER